MSLFSGQYEGVLEESRMQVQGLSGTVSFASVEGSIGAGKSTFLEFVRRFLEEYRLDATDPAHVDENDQEKDYFLIVAEPVDEWMARVHEHNGELLSLLELFNRYPTEMGFPFQCIAFSSRLDRLKQSLTRIVPTKFPRRIHIISERSVRSDKLFIQAVVDTTPDDPTLKHQLYAYNRFHDVFCMDVMEHHNMIIYIPTPPEECAQRIKTRDRLGECGIKNDYLTALDQGHEKMIHHFSGSVFKLDELKSSMTDLCQKEYCYSFMQNHRDRVSMIGK